MPAHPLAIKNYDPHLIRTDHGWLYNDKPFTGFMIEDEKNNRIVYQLPIIEGIEEGIALGWYNTGEKLLQRPFKHGKIEGCFTQWWPNGKIRYRCHYINNSYQGLQEVFFPNGKLQQESHFQSGKEEGLQRTWDSTGNLISNYTIHDNQLYGVITVKSCLPDVH